MLHPFIIEGIAQDAVFHLRLMKAIRRRRDAALVSMGLLPSISLFVAESHDRLRESLPGFKVEPPDAIDLIRPARHRTKLLPSSRAQLGECPGAC